jgi:signal transduction histidine kinase
MACLGGEHAHPGVTRDIVPFRTGASLSLRARILLLFLGFSVLPVVFLGAGDYYQSLEALRVVLEARSDALAEQAAREVEAAHSRARAALSAAARLEQTDDPVGPFAGVAVVDERSAIPSIACGTGATVPVRMDMGTAGSVSRQTVEAALPVETLLSWAPSVRAAMGKDGFTQILDRETGRLLLDTRCIGSAQSSSVTVKPHPVPAVSSAATRLGVDHDWHASLRYQDQDRETFAAISAAGPEWAVAVHTSGAEFVAPFRQARVLYLGLVLLVMSIAAGAFLLLAQGAFRSLRLVTAAADQIELGNLRPWLPPPGEDEVGRLSLAFRRMTERLESSLRRAELNQKLAAVGELATYLSHEIRNPLSSIRLSLQSLHRDVKAGYVPTDAPRVIEIALSEVKRLDGVVRAVLEMGRPSSPAEGRTCAVHEALEETLDVLRPKVRAQGIELVYAPRAERDLVHGDADGLRSVVINLVVNAMDALDGRAESRIRISTWSREGGELHVRVADNGPGVSPGVADSIFEPFFTTKARGNGIGLPTALRTVQAWGGTIVHEPVAAGSGAVFVVKLKLADPPPADPAPDERLMTVNVQR